jgi:diacylglycerol kinase
MDEDQVVEKQTWMQWVTIKEKSYKKDQFHNIMSMVLAYSIISTLYFGAFGYSSNSNAIWILEIISTVFFILEIFSCFLETYVDHKGEEVVALSKIAKNYIMRGFFMLDVVAAIPYFILDNKNYMLIRLIRLVYAKRIIKLFDIQKSSEWFISKIDEYIQRKSKIGLKFAMKTVFKIIKLITITLIITYTLGCISYILGDKITSIAGLDTSFI